MLYPKNGSPVPDPELFRNPSSEYRAAPFWAWNCDLDDDLLTREIGVMKEMGMGGFHMHTRVGMSVPYLSDEYMGHIRACTDEAKRKGMLAWLYDEDKWPSGYAGGFVTEKAENRQKYLLLTPSRVAEPEESDRLLAVYTVTLDGNGALKSYARIPEDGSPEPEGCLWYAYLRLSKATPWFHFKGYADTLFPDAIDDFIRITHERYKECLGEDLGTVCPAIFTDEPQMTRKTELLRAAEPQDIVLSWTADLEDTYRKTYGESLLDRLPEVIWELPEGISRTRYRYHDHVTERFVSAYCDRIGAWCRKNGILMTGHMMDEGSLRSQTRAVGECMRAYRGFTLPGIDMLCDGREFNTAKQCASAVHQQGCPGMISELYGVTNWDFDFRGHKLQGDWQAALGVTVRVPHLYWASMHGESKRDYPASIGHQSAWWKEYSYIEDHFARVNTLMTRGRPLVRVGVIHPVETYWISYGPADQTGGKRAELDQRFEELTRWLLLNNIDFDFVCESTLPSLYREGGPGFTAGQMTYDAVIVPACETLRSSTLKALRDFRSRGGEIFFLGEIPRWLDAVPSEDVTAFAGSCPLLPVSKTRLISALEPYREIRITNRYGVCPESVLYGLREDGGCRNLFLCRASDCDRSKPAGYEDYRVELRGVWDLTLYDTLSGEIRALPAGSVSGNTVFTWRCHDQDSLLLRLSPADGAGTQTQTAVNTAASGSYGIHMSEEFTAGPSEDGVTLLPDPFPVTLSEDNVCLLDTACWHVDDGPWQPEEEMLRVGVKAREVLGMSTAPISGAQPWVLPPEKPVHTLTVRASFLSDITAENVFLALEDIEGARILFNGQPLEAKPAGCFVDSAIVKLPAGPVLKGVNTVEVTRPFTVSSSVENMFLTGSFGVKVTGREIRLIPLPERLWFGDWCSQGLPFYSGPLTCRFTVEGGKRMKLRLGLFAVPCVTLDLDGKRVASLSLAPHEADLGFLPEGPHTLEITLWASRINTFGTFHLNDGSVIWYGPNAWRSEGDRWTYEYRLRPSGLLSEPKLITE